MSLYRGRPVTVDAEQYDGQHSVRGMKRDASGALYVLTMHSQRIYVEKGDWIIAEHDKVHYYPCKNEVFVTKYEKVD